MREVKLYGHLGAQFGRSFMFDVASPAEAMAALRANFPGFQKAVVEHAPGYHVFVGKENIGRDDLAFQSATAPIKIVPYIAGAKAGMFQTIFGAVLMAVGYLGETIGLAYGGAVWGPALVSLGGAMMVGGIAQLLFSPPTPNKPKEKAGNDPSFSFNGAVNTTAQGNIVPICYGEMTVGSQVVSAGLSVEQLMVATPVTGTTSPVTSMPQFFSTNYP